MKSATNHRKINTDLYRLGIFGKTALSQYNLNKSFQVMATGTNVKFYICQNVESVCLMTELNSLRIPTSIDELPQLIPYFDRLCNVLEAIYSNCYSRSNCSDRATTSVTAANSNDSILEPRVLKAVIEKTVDM